MNAVVNTNPNVTGTAIQKVSIRHEMILDFLMTNPRVKLGDVAFHFGLTQGWLSQVIHSDAFQEMLRNKQHIAFHHTVLPIREKMLNVAHQALDALVEKIPEEGEAKNLSSIAGDVLDRLGFGAPRTGGPTIINNQQNNHYVSGLAEEINEARKLFGAPARVLEVAQDGNGRTVLALPAASDSGVGPAFEGAFLSLTACERGESEIGRALREESPLETRE